MGHRTGRERETEGSEHEGSGSVVSECGCAVSKRYVSLSVCALVCLLESYRGLDWKRTHLITVFSI